MSPTEPGVQEFRSTLSRRRILDATVRTLIEFGYAGTSTLKVQEVAQVSRGRLLHQFASRDLLLIAAAHDVAERQLAFLTRTAADFLPHSSRESHRIEHAVKMLWDFFRQDTFRAQSELMIGARHNPELHAALVTSQQRIHRSLQQTFAELVGSHHSAHLPFEAVCDILITSMRGVALTYSFRQRNQHADPHLADWVAMVETLLGPKGGLATVTADSANGPTGRSQNTGVMP